MLRVGHGVMHAISTVSSTHPCVCRGPDFSISRARAVRLAPTSVGFGRRFILVSRIYNITRHYSLSRLSQGLSLRVSHRLVLNCSQVLAQ